MHALIFISTLLSFSSPVYADVGCGPSPRPYEDTAVDTAVEIEKPSEEEGEEEETASNRVNRMDLALLFLPVIGLTVASRRK